MIAGDSMGGVGDKGGREGEGIGEGWGGEGIREVGEGMVDREEEYSELIEELRLERVGDAIERAPLNIAGSKVHRQDAI